MTEWRVQVVQLGKIGKHPNADTLSITQVHGNYPVIIKSGEFSPGDLAVHIPPDSLVPVDRPEFSWLADKAVNGYHRVRFTKLRKVPSYGFLVPIARTRWFAAVRPGDLLHDELGVKKYDPGPCYTLEGQGDAVRVPCEDMIPYYDIEGLRKYETLFSDGEPVWITEKIHGSNGRWVFLDGELYCGSRTRFRKDSVWNRMADKYNLKAILEATPGLVLYGEVYGPGIQDLTYGIEEPAVRFFDLYNTRTGRYTDSEEFEQYCSRNNLPIVPTLYRGPFSLSGAYALAEGKSTIAGHVREGIVVKPLVERWDQELGRVFLKLPGEGYLLRKVKDATETATAAA